ncbi:MAG: hypothetical protein M1298_01140 [Chloroflexi bacterium]|nr:hypothetical protein [Chloroflexota bacterium]
MLSFDTDRIKSYVFATGNLRDNPEYEPIEAHSSDIRVLGVAMQVNRGKP